MKFRYAIVPNRGTYRGSETVTAVVLLDDKSEALAHAAQLDGHRVLEVVDRTQWYGWELDREPSVEA